MNKDTYQSITTLEKDILNTKRYSNVSMAHQLNEVNRLRRDFYKEESTTVSKQDEYKDFCDFNYSLLTSKKLSNALYFSVVRNLLNSYDDVKPFDEDLSSFEYTVDCLNDLNSVLLNKCNNLPRIRIMNSTISRFMEKYEDIESLSKTENEETETYQDNFDDDFSM